MLSSVKDMISICFLAGGGFFCLTTMIGMFRLPDFYTRCHASGNSETLGLLLVGIGFIIQAGASILSLKIILLFLIICICNPIGTHVLSRSAYQSGYPMVRKDHVPAGTLTGKPEPEQKERD